MRRLIDISSNTGTHLTREMGLYFGSHSGNFSGRVDQLETGFRVEFVERRSNIYDSSGNVIEQYVIK